MAIDSKENYADTDAYLRAVSVREHPVASALRAATSQLPYGEWSTNAEQGQLLAFVVEAFSTRRILELGTFTGYGTLMMALAMPADGKIVTCDLDTHYPDVGRPYWVQAGVAERIELRLGPATETVQQLIDAGQSGSFDAVFIDCNKKDYNAYYEAALQLLRVGGVIVVDNIFWNGAVLRADAQEKSTKAIRALAHKMHGDERINLAVLPLGDGMTLAVKR
ncbi:MAG: putative O-methyltransferase YrrM [Gammaproteobacteria bacterium]|jgi:predicted O-methyltransferase YrrM